MVHVMPNQDHLFVLARGSWVASTQLMSEGKAPVILLVGGTSQATSAEPVFLSLLSEDGDSSAAEMVSMGMDGCCFSPLAP